MNTYFLHAIAISDLPPLQPASHQGLPKNISRPNKWSQNGYTMEPIFMIIKRWNLFFFKKGGTILAPFFSVKVTLGHRYLWRLCIKLLQVTGSLAHHIFKSIEYWFRWTYNACTMSSYLTDVPYIDHLQPTLMVNTFTSSMFVCFIT